MKNKILILILLLITIFCKAQEVPFYSSLKIYGNLTTASDLYLIKWGTSLEDTMGIVLLPTGKVDTVLLAVQASKGWEYDLMPFYKFYNKSENLKSLPLPYPDGTERRKINVMYAYYQIEFELERLNRYLKRNWNGDLIRTIVIILLTIGFVYNGYEIYKLKKMKKKKDI
jgi:hypothetical protein